MRMPEITYSLPKSSGEVIQLRGLNWSDSLRDGDLRECENISARRYPYFTTRHGRTQQKRGEALYQNVTGLTAWNKLVVIEKTDDTKATLYYDGEAIGTLTPGEKQFAVVNTKMVIMPDKVYFDMPTKSIKPMAASVTGSKATFSANYITVSWDTDLTTLFAVGDAVKISGCTTNAGNNKTVVITALTSTRITTSANAFTAATEASTAITIAREIPDMDFICESENRLWGCSSEKQTIYASALGDPTNFNVFEGLSTDSYAVAVGSEGNFTGCCKLTSSVLFWKETKLHKMLGGYPAEYALYTYDIDGLMSGCHKSLQVINEVLYYMGLHGVYAYSGGVPSLISSCFGEKKFSDAVGGSDGDTYFLSVLDEENNSHLLSYETRYNIWTREDGTKATDFARVGRDLYFADSSGAVWLADNSQSDKTLEWNMQFVPFYETISGHKAYSKITMRFELPKQSFVTVEIKLDNKPWRQVGKLIGSVQDIATLRLPVNRCDKFELRLSGRGECTLLSLYREFYVGSDV